MAYTAPAFVDLVPQNATFPTLLLTGNLDTVKLTNGGFALIGDLGGGIGGQIYNSAGTPVQAIAPILGTVGAIDQLSDGNLIVSSQDAEGARFTIVSSTTGQVIFTVVAQPGATSADITALTTGEFAIASHFNFTNPPESDVLVSIYTDSGIFVRTLSPDNTPALDTDVSVAGLDNGSVAMSWTRTDGSGNTKIFYAVYDSNGDPVIAQTELASNDPNINRNSHIEAINGGFAIAYERRVAPNFTVPSSVDIFVDTFDLSGARTFGYVITNLGVLQSGDDDGSNDSDPHLSRSPDGNLLVTYSRQDGSTGFTVIKGDEQIEGAILGLNTAGAAGVVFDAAHFAIFGANGASTVGQHFFGNTDGTGDGGDDGGFGDDFKDTMNGGAGADTLFGGANNDELKGEDGDDELHGGVGNDVLSGAGDTGDDFSADTLFGEDGDDDVSGAGGEDTLHGGTGNDRLFGTGGIEPETSEDNAADQLFGEQGNDTLEGGGGADTLEGGIGNDTYINPTGDMIVEALNEGTDIVVTSATFSLLTIANVENVTLTGASDVNAGGNALNNVLRGNDANNRLRGEDGTDTLIGGLGNDTYVNPTGDVITELAAGGTDTVESDVTFTLFGRQQVENLTLTGTANINGTGNSYNNVLRGNSLANRLDGGLGNDTLIGGAGNDTYINPTGDTITELAGGGTDTVESNVTFTLSGHQQVENLLLTGGGNIDGTGNSHANFITENIGVNTLRGGEGNDTIIGGNADTVFGDGGDDTIIELFANVGTKDGGSGNDLLDVSAASNGFDYDPTFDLSAPSFAAYGNTYIGFESIIATHRADTIIGTAGRNYLDGFTGNDTLTGGAGIDTLVGGQGNDTYFVDDFFDQTNEALGAGTDHVISSISRTLSANLENLTLTGTAHLTGNGNELGNLVTGNVGNNVLRGYASADTLVGGMGNDTLDGGTGNDAMAGGVGNDTYFVDAFFDQTTEDLGGGADHVISSISRTLTANIENLTLVGAENLTGNGNDLGNLVTGNGGNNLLRGYAGADTLVGAVGNDTLDGGTGNDKMAGGAGNDTYFVDAYFDETTEALGGGTDLVISSISRTLSVHVENLTLTGSENLTANGNELGNLVTGNAGNNVLWGKAGADTLVGAGGNDTLEGGTGNDAMAGGAGNDTYYVDTFFDQTTEALGAGTDLVISSISRTLTANLENLTLAGSDSLSGNGNELGNLLTGNTAFNVLRGYAGADTLVGGVGRDTLDPGVDAVRDVIRYTSVADSTGVNRDVILGMDLLNEDRFDLTVVVTGIRATVTGALSTQTFDAQLAAAVGAAQIGAGQALLFDPTSGNLDQPDRLYLVVDANGVAGYQAGADYVIELFQSVGTLSLDDFI